MSQTTRPSMIVGLQHRDPKAWTRFIETYQPAIKGWATACWARHCSEETSARQIAEEIAADLGARICDKVQTYDWERGRFRSWLRKVSLNLTFDFLRRRIREEKLRIRLMKALVAETGRRQLRSSISGVFIPFPEGKRYISSEQFDAAKQKVRGLISPRDWAIMQDVGWEDGRTWVVESAGVANTKLSLTEAAKKHGLSPGAVGQVKSRALRHLRTILNAPSENGTEK